MLAAAAFAAAMGAAQASELDFSRMEDVLDPRLFIVLNGSNTDNLAQYVLGAIGLVLLLGIILALVLFAFGFFGGNQQAAYNRYDYYEPDSYATYQQGAYNQGGFSQGFQARSLGGAYDAINVLYMLEEAFAKMKVLEFECQQRAVCEAHEADAANKFGQVATDLQKIIGSVDEATVQKSEKFSAFREAARRGAQQQDCQQTYAAKCRKGLRDYLSADTKY